MDTQALSAMTARKLVTLMLQVIIVLIVRAPHAAGQETEAARDKAADAIAPQPADDAPLAFPPLDHYARLWESSLFTTRSLPPPDAEPKGPVFTDSLTLAGMYEVDGAVVGVILDKTTSQIIEVRIGSENESGIKIVRVTPGVTPDKTRLQLQKGEEFGWVTFADASAAPAEVPATGKPIPNPNQQGSAIPGRPVIPRPLQGGQPSSSPMTAPVRNAPSPLNPGASPAPASPVSAPTPPASANGDVPLPPQ